MATNEKKTIGVFSDGYYFFMIWNHYDSEKKATFDLKKLFGGFILYEVSAYLGIHPSHCDVTGFHHYAGGSAETEAQQRFEKALVDTGLGMNICRPPLISTSDGKRKEKGVDGQLMLDAFEAVVMEKRYNVLVLVAGDADFYPLIERVKRKSIPTFLICWNLDATNTVTSSDLIKIADHALLMHDILGSNATKNPFVGELLVKKPIPTGQFQTNLPQQNSIESVIKNNLLRRMPEEQANRFLRNLTVAETPQPRPLGASIGDAISSVGETPAKDLQTLLLETARECTKKEEGWMLTSQFGEGLIRKGYDPKEKGEKLTYILQRYLNLFELKPDHVRLRSQSDIQTQPNSSTPIAGPRLLTQEELDKEHESLIIKIEPERKFGFIKSLQYSNDRLCNYYFSFVQVLNWNEEDLCAGMKVKFSLEYDSVRSAKEGVPRYRATNIYVLG